MWWNDATRNESRKYRCGFCGALVASDLGYWAYSEDNEVEGSIRICPHCEHPTYFDFLCCQYPGLIPGNDVEHLPDDVAVLYRDARQCVAVNAHSSAALTCRKLLMNLAVERGASKSQTFAQYVDYLVDNNYVPANGKGWVDRIRTKGNEATHEIATMSSEDSAELIAFVEMLLKLMYEFPARVIGHEKSG